MTGQRFAVGAGVVGLMVLTLVLFFTSLASVRTVRIDSFQRSGDQQKVIVNVTLGVGDEIVERSVDEDERTVKVTVRVRQPTAPRVALGVPVPIVVSLGRPLAERAVVDYDGSAVRDLGMYSPPGGPAQRP